MSLPSPSSPSADDIRWLGTLSSTELSTHLASGFTLTILSLPPHSTLTLDLRVYTTGLTHVLALPPAPALHALTILPPPGAGAPTAAVSAFVTAAAGANMVAIYDDASASLRLSPSAPSPASVNDRGVAVFSLPHARSWARLFSRASVGHLGACGGVGANEAVVGDDGVARGAGERAVDGEGGPVRLRFAALPRGGEGLQGAALTEFCRERSAYVSWLVATRFGGRVDGLLGEMQVAFVGFLHVQCVRALGHWGLVVREICWAPGLVDDAPEVCEAFAGVLRAMLGCVEREVLDVDGDGLREAVMAFCTSGGELGGVKELERFVVRKFRWLREPKVE